MNLDDFITRLRSEGRSSPGGTAWHKFWLELSTASRGPADNPPMPLILGASACSNADKLSRLREQLQWASERGRLVESILFLQAIPLEHWNRGGDLNWSRDSYSRGHFGWTSDPKPKLSRDQAIALIHLLRSRWSDVAGEQLSAVCHPICFSGQKARRLVVESVIGSRPPWGSWQSFSPNTPRTAFSVLRASVNRAIAPHAVDHIEFWERMPPRREE